MAASPAHAAASRLFLALWPGPHARSGLAAWRDAWHWPAGAALVASERLHLTLHFLGTLGADRLIALQGALAVPFTGFDLVLVRATVWPRGIAVLQPRATPPALTNLQRALGAALQRQGVALEARPWQPHVTLARRAEGATPPDDGRALRWRVRGYALVESRLGSNGGYRVLQRYH